MRPCVAFSFLTAVVLSTICVAECQAQELIWVEGENAVSDTMQDNGWYNSVRKTELSGGAWLSHFKGGEMPVATYHFEASVAGEHEFWLRANPVTAELRVRINGGDWQSISLAENEQNINIASDGRPDLRFVAWVKAGMLPLQAGENVLEVRFESKNNHHGGLDCFVLSRTPFLPQGNRKPGQKLGLADPGKWAFEPDRDLFSTEALLDLSYLNEKPAGKNGRVRRSPNGADFVDGSGKPLRFWAVNTGVQFRDDVAVVDEHARWLAKRGVNMVRHHGHLAPGPGAPLTDVNQEDIDAAWRLVGAMKKHGIYVTLSPYWAVSVKPQPAWGLKSSDGENLTGLIFFDKQLQDAYKGWLRALMTRPNPHTGIPLAEDPTVALFQIQNEDSLLFWTESSIQGEQRKELARQFGDWLVKKYGSLDKATQAWGGATGVQGDDFSNRTVMPQKIWNLTQSQSGAMAARFDDQLHFYTQLMYDFNLEISRFLKEDLGYDGLINAGNWRTADSAKLLDAERYAYSANDVIGVNRYYNGGQHANPTESHKAGYLISEGDTFRGESALKRPWDFPLALRQVQGHPMIISESAWVPPLRYQSEGPFLVAAYGALTGFDIFYWFSTDDIGFGPPMGKWQISSPAQLGMFPAAALMFRQGYVQQGKPVLVEHRSLDEVWSRTSPLLPEEAGFDPNRDSRTPANSAEAAAQGRVTPLTYLVGGVEVEFSEGKTELADLTTFIDSTARSVRSITGELTWNYGDGLCTLNAPKANGVTGNLAAAGRVVLDALTVDGRNQYATVLAVAVDDQELSNSTQVLVQIGTIARPYGWQTTPDKDDSERITDRGGSPWNIEDSDIEIQLANRTLSKATQLDANGLAVKDLTMRRTPDGLTLKLPSDAMYVLLR
ncbi:hypothetical protein [Aureliella helgolandensis]|uniref:Glycoside hydrolase family 42 N-terminal domain-containing protein n=1 Tax=Aureliella helgolandensis TaxID=2527968 RepID=A0A518GCZ5_9BACT|nr:hypothetical protein [Aureliella helgolandensis]QDV26453.1 hypothetical protein Q31a_48270 [Aureliella helgolandensis]